MIFPNQNKGVLPIPVRKKFEMPEPSSRYKTDTAVTNNSNFLSKQRGEARPISFGLYLSAQKMLPQGSQITLALLQSGPRDPSGVSS